LGMKTIARQRKKKGKYGEDRKLVVGLRESVASSAKTNGVKKDAIM